MGVEFTGAGGSFSDPGRSFDNLEAAVVATMVTAATDIALLIDRNGRINDVAVDDNHLFGEARKAWLGRRFVDVVTTESRPKVEKMLTEDSQGTLPKRREVNHPMPDGADLPVSYTVLTLSREDGARIALGRELRSVSLLQQKLVETQLAMENDYARLRNAEAQYRVLFDTAADPTLIVDAATRKVTEANAAGRRMLESDGRRVVGQSLHSLFADQSLRELDQLLAAARVSGETETADLILTGDDCGVQVALRFYRQHGTTRLSLRFGRPAPISLSADSHDLIAKAGRELPDGLVVVDTDMRIVAVNESFLDLAEITTSHQALGRPLPGMIGRRSVEMSVVRSAIDAGGTVRGFGTTLTTEHGTVVEVEISGTAMREDGRTFYAFSLRRGGRQPVTGTGPEPLRSANDMTGLVGRVPLREIVRETVDIIEQLCIKAALDITRNNRASASEMLGLSRQSLYSKLRRYGIGETGPSGAGEDIGGFD